MWTLDATGFALPERHEPRFPTSLAWSPDSTIVGWGDTQGGIHHWHNTERSRGRVLSMGAGAIHDLMWSPAGKTVLAASEGGWLGIGSVFRGRMFGLSRASDRTLRLLHWQANGGVLASNSDGMLIMWCPKLKRTVRSKRFPQMICAAAYCDEGRRIVLLLESGHVYFLQGDDWRCVGKWELGERVQHGYVTFRSSSLLLATVSRKRLRIWQIPI